MIDELLAYAGIDDDYADAFGRRADVSVETKLAILNALGYDVSDDASAARVLRDARVADGLHSLKPVYVVREGDARSWPDPVAHILDPDTEPGYYDLEIGEDTSRAIVAPRQAYVAPGVDRARVWGASAQLYALRSKTNWGIGDFGDLQALVALTRQNGGSLIGLNPLHQLHLTNPSAASPYAPLSRRYLNALYIDVAAAAREFGVSVDDRAAAALRASEFVDYAGVARAKLAALEQIFDAIRVDRELDAFSAREPDVRAAAVYEAIMEVFSQRDPSIRTWLQWPAELRDQQSNAVRVFAQAHERRIAFYMFLQWLADRQLAGAADVASGMAIGLYRDLAVGVDLASVDVWSDPDAYALGLSVGAPPDPLNPAGQNWGLPPLHPRALVARAYDPFIALLRANMRHAGALRIDHVMGLRRLFCIPRERPAGGGAYVKYDFEAMLGIVALESHLHRCMVIGEDLGTVPEGFRERLAPERIFSCRVLLFERDETSFRPPSEYPADSVASTGTHDLPTLTGWWRGADIETRERLGWIDAQAAREEQDERKRSRAALVRALRDAGCLGEEEEPDEHTVLLAAHGFLARAGSRVVLVQLEDLLAQREQVNVPGTTTEEPNWTRKLALPIDAFETNDTFAAILRIMREERPLNREVVA
ncbi:MAG: 4-alpha-glucanotransferase [Candidatus Eremiobacteraeota bacterium]|nr:4-alpha-glucanotransferase [Candidatus Eremiobacteraeota bacterium]